LIASVIGEKQFKVSSADGNSFGGGTITIKNYINREANQTKNSTVEDQIDKNNNSTPENNARGGAIDVRDLAPRVSPLFAGVPQAPTPANNVANLQIATTEFVRNYVNDPDLSPYAPKVSPTFFGNPRAPTALTSTANTQIATTEFVVNRINATDLSPYATKESPTFTGVPIAPTPTPVTANTQIATTAFVQAQKANIVLTGIPRAPTPDGNVLDQISTVEYVQNSLETFDLSSYAKLNSPLFTGIPRAPTPNQSTVTNQLATCEFVQRAIGAIPGPDTSNALWQGSRKFVSNTDPDPSQGSNGDFWFKYQS